MLRREVTQNSYRGRLRVQPVDEIHLMFIRPSQPQTTNKDYV